MSEQKFNAFAEDEEKVIYELKTSRDGLSSSAAASRLAEYGENELEEQEQTSILQKFAEQFKDLMIVILLIAAILSIVLPAIETGNLFAGNDGWSDAIIILAVVIINAVLGVYQEVKAEDAINSLKELTAPNANVRRDGEIKNIPSKNIVPGDIIVLEAGDIVPADARIFASNSLQIEEAALTGESVPSTKYVDPVAADAALGDRKNMAFSSTNVTYGRGEAVVITTGMNTEVGKIQGMLDAAETRKTPLQEDQDKLSVVLTWLIVIISVVIFIMGMMNPRLDVTWLDMLLTAISVAVAALPEGLPAITTIILALGTQRMAEEKALVRKLPAVETLGSTDIICSDKTGTLTQNKMTIEKVYYNGQLFDADDDISFEEPIFRIMNMANDSNISSGGEVTGDPTETAMITFGIEKGFDHKAVLGAQPRVAEVPFESDRKMSSTIHPTREGDVNGKYVYLTKGAPDVLLSRCTRYIENGEIKPLDQAKLDEILEVNHDLAVQALRVMAMAYRYDDELPEEETSEHVERDLIFAGLIGEIDPERPEAKGAISTAKKAGVRTVMITGDHQDTAAAIAERLGILEDVNDKTAVTTGHYLDAISDEQLAAEVENYSVYARVAPEHKVRIVKAWQSHNKVVAMTGDGVNDAPSLKNADIGIGMGITGTEVSKGASDMVLADDNFATIVNAIEEGRKVYANIQKAIQFLLSANLGEVLTIFIGTMLGWTVLEPIHILWINLVTDTFPAIALGLEASESDIMDKAPRGRRTSFLADGVGVSIIYQGIFEGLVTLTAYWYTEFMIPGTTHADAEAVAFLVLAFIQLAHAFNCKSVFQSLFASNPFSNKVFNLAIVVSAALVLITVFIPGLNDIFGTAHLVGSPVAGQMWLTVIVATLSIIVYVEIVKAILRASGYADKVQRKRAQA